jgi:lipoprotein-anchoring transpeptidase ErfK/SrfK
MSVSPRIFASGLAPLPSEFQYAWFVPFAFARLGILLAIIVGAARAQEPNRPVESVFEAQVELHRRGFSCGSIDGVAGPQTAAALRAFQRHRALPETGILDPDTREQLHLTAPALTTHLVNEDELATLQPVPPTWLEKSQLIALTHASALELIAERYRASPRLVRRLNPDVNWDAVPAGTPVTVPAVAKITFPGKAAWLTIRLEARTLEAADAEGRVLAHFPVSIARKVEKRPRGELRVTVVIPDPNYTFDPQMYPESPEAKESLTRKLIVPPGPNNPVGLAWIGLDLPGYGIHGTPEPEKVGRTESHGCFRLANWDAVALVGLVAVGLPVVVEP